MPVCPICGKQLLCGDHSADLNTPVKPCPKDLPGSLWVRVLDEDRNGVEGIDVSTAGQTSHTGKTKSGFAGFDSLAAGPYSVALGQIPEAYDKPAEIIKSAAVEKGSTKVISFKLQRRAKLNVQIVEKNSPGSVVKGLVVNVTRTPSTGAAGTKPTKDGVYDFGYVSAGEHKLLAAFLDADQKDFEFVKTEDKVTLKGGEEKTIPFEVERQAKVHVEILFERKSSSDPKEYFTAADIPVKASLQGSSPKEMTVRTGATGIAAFPSLPPGNYTFTPDYTGIDKTLFDVDDKPQSADLVSGDNAPQLFEVITRKHKLKVKIVLRPDPTAVPQPPEVLFTKLPVKITANSGTEQEVKTGEHDFGHMKPDTYKLTAIFSDPDQNDYDFPDPSASDPKPTEREIKLEKDEVVVFQVEPLYKKVRFIGHCLATIAKFEWKEAAVPDTYGGLAHTDLKSAMEKAEREHGKADWKADYVGLDDEEADITARLNFISATIDKAEEKASKNDDELKVFVLPECFFLGRYGAYQVKNIPVLMEKLVKLVSGPRWRHWVFLFGTVNGHSEPTAKELGTVQEFFNVAPVIRGGCGESPDNIKLIQKAYYSAEILDSDDIADKTVYGSKQITSETVKAQFQPTEAEGVLGILIENLLPNDKSEEPLVKNQAISDRVTDWDAVRGKVKDNLKAEGITNLIRDVRGLQTGEKDRVLTPDVEKFKQVVKDYLEEDRTEFYLGGPHLKQKKPSDFETNYPAKDYPGVTWRDRIQPRGSDHLLAPILEHFLSNAEPEISGNTLAATVSGGISTEPWNKLKDLAKAEAKKRGSIELAGQIRSATSASEEWLKVLRELLTLYFADPKFTDPRQQLLKPRAHEFLRIEDYSFQCKRKPGPWLPAGDTSLQKKKVVFGVETCADHTKGRLKYSKPTSGTKPLMDIHIIPSAGMAIMAPNGAVRMGGYIFNCDGWNGSSAFFNAMVARKTAFLPRYTDTWPLRSGCNPMLPHTELAKLGAGYSWTFVKDTKDPSDASKDLKNPDSFPLTSSVDTIFAYGPGELHVYQPQDLPK